MSEIRVAIAGVGNCASSLIQGVEMYREQYEKEKIIPEKISGLITTNFGGYYPWDIKFVLGIDVDNRKVGHDLSKAVFEMPNCTTVFYKNIKNLDAPVIQGYIIDSIAPHMPEYPLNRRFAPLDNIDTDEDTACARIVKELKEKKVDVLVNYLPVGSEENTKFYARCALEAKIAFINAIPVFVSQFWGEKFKKAGIPILGDDIKSQLGATILHRVITRLFEDRGIKIKKTYQLNVGGNTDFLNMLDRKRLKSKKISKTNAVTSQMDEVIAEENIYVGPSDYVPWLNDNKICYIRVDGEHYGGAPLYLDLKLSVEDSPNSAGVITDAIRAAKVAIDKKMAGPIIEASAYLFKSPVKQYEDSVALRMLKDFAGIKE